MATPEVCFLVARDDENVMERVAKHLVGMRRRYEQRGVTFALYSLDHQWELDAFSRQRLLEAVAVIGVISPSLLSILGLNEALRTVLAEKREQRRGRLLPFVLVSCDWQHEETPFSDLQPLNASGKPIAGRHLDALMVEEQIGKRLQEALDAVLSASANVAPVPATPPARPPRPVPAPAGATHQIIPIPLAPTQSPASVVPGQATNAVLLVYARADQRSAQEAMTALHARHVPVLDLHDFAPGERQENVRRSLARARRLILLVSMDLLAELFSRERSSEIGLLADMLAPADMRAALAVVIRPCDYRSFLPTMPETIMSFRYYPDRDTLWSAVAAQVVQPGA